MDIWGDYWRVTGRTAERLFGDVFGVANIDVRSYGNALTAVGFLHGITAQELTLPELDTPHPDFEVSVAVRATKVR